jgi:glutamine amidotransferase-like uncharacterized protein
LALIYRGPASRDGGVESVAALLRAGPQPFRVRYVGPDADTDVDAAVLAEAALYVQPGGDGDVEDLAPGLAPVGELLRPWIRSGGRYLGICMGAYLAGDDPGFGLLSGAVDQYAGSPGADVPDEREACIAVDWGGERREVFFQDGPYFLPAAGELVLARYAANGAAAALVAAYGRGRVAVVGPHPEATALWFRAAGVPRPQREAKDLAHALIERLMADDDASVTGECSALPRSET